MKFTQTYPEFQRHLQDVADKYEKPVATVYEWWRKYSDTCRDYDQSPVLFEFENWYKSDLTSPTEKEQQ